MEDPTIDADASRYNASKALAAGVQNRTVSWLMRCVPWVGIEGRHYLALVSATSDALVKSQSWVTLLD